MPRLPSGGVTVEGRREVSAAFAALGRDLEDMSAPNRRIATLLMPGVRRRTPVLTGALEASWQAEAGKLAAAVTSGLPYAGPVEYGSARRGIPGARMVADTIEAEAEAVVTAYADTIEERGRRRGFAP